MTADNRGAILYVLDILERMEADALAACDVLGWLPQRDNSGHAHSQMQSALFGIQQARRDLLAAEAEADGR